MRKSKLFLLFISLFYTDFLFAWSWQLGIVNNLNTPLKYQFNQNNSGNAWAEDGSKNVGIIPPNGTQTFQLTTGGTFNKTTDGVLNISNSNGLNCSLRYYQQAIYSAHNLSSWRLDGNNSPECSELFLSSTEASDDGWHPIDLIFNAVKFPRLTRGQIQCAGIDNCVVVNPPHYTAQWSVQNINRQTHMSDYEPLNMGQTIGTHNSVISRNYTLGHVASNMSYIDPNQYITLTDQLNLGVRQIELDFFDTNASFKICHFRMEESDLKDFLNIFLCENNFDLTAALQELQEWLSSHPNELIYVYLDNVLPWSPTRANVFDVFLNGMLHGKVLSKTDLNLDILPVNSLTKNDIVNKLKKNVVVYTHNTDPNLAASPFVFTHVLGNPAIELHNDVNISDFSSAQAKCNNNKSCTLREIFPADPAHNSLRVIREDRTHLQQQKGAYQNFSVYLTNSKLNGAINYPVNVFDFDKLALDDARLIQAVWSFQYPYPISVQSGGVDYAFISPTTGRFSNQKLTQANFDILCFNKETQKWFVTNNGLISENAQIFAAFHNDAEQACAQFGNSVFAAPVSGYQLDEIVKSSLIKNPTVINYAMDAQGAWHINDDKTVGFVTKE